MNYKKTQIGWLVIGIFIPIIFISYLAYANQWGNDPLPLDSLKAIVLIFVLIAALFYKLTIEIDGGVLKLIYYQYILQIPHIIRFFFTPGYFGFEKL